MARSLKEARLEPQAPLGQDASTPLVQPRALDHVNLHVRDADESLAFYTAVLGLTIDRVERDGQGRATFVMLRACKTCS